MRKAIHVTLDGKEITGKRGQTIMQVADDAGIYVPRLCSHDSLSPHGSCRLCTVIVNGRPQAACTQPVAEGMVIEHDTPQLRQARASLVEMLLVEGNHFCPSCEKSGNCELQAMAYRFGIAAPRYASFFPRRDIDMSHEHMFLEHNRCIMCARCARASRELDGKSVFGFVGRGLQRRVSPGAQGLGATEIAASDAAADICPVGALVRKRVGYKVPIGERKYDHAPIGSDVENRS